VGETEFQKESVGKKFGFLKIGKAGRGARTIIERGRK